jgi:hypothetical protein
MNNLHQIVELLNDPLFVEFELDQEAPTIFNAVGRTHTERWHSAFIAWLLDPYGSHGLRDYPLRKFVALLAAEDTLNEGRGLSLLELFTDGAFESAKTVPNEREPAEHKEPNGSEFDVYVRGIRLHDDSPWKEVRLLVETKVRDKIHKAQCAKYISFIEACKPPPSAVFIVPVFVAPTHYYEDDVEMEELFGHPSWIGLDYRKLYDQIIYPCLTHPKTSEFGKILMAEYAKTLRHHSHSEKPLIMMTQQDRKLALALFEKHKDAIRTLYGILAGAYPEEDFDPQVVEEQAGEAVTLKIKISGVTFLAASVRDLYEQVLKYLCDNRHLDKLQPMPFNTSAERSLLAKDRIHPSGKPFWQPVSYGPYFMESNKSHSVALAHLKKLVQACGLAMEELT